MMNGTGVQLGGNNDDGDGDDDDENDAFFILNLVLCILHVTLSILCFEVVLCILYLACGI